MSARFGPGTLTWRVNGEAVLLIGGGRALILQVAHPKVAAGVAQHSSYREEPWRRLYQTLNVTLRIVFGDDATSTAAANQLRTVHSRVTGNDDRGEPYRALDPELLLWVHATLIDTSLTVYERWVKPLSDGERSAYYEEMKDLGELYGIPRERMPADLEAFGSYWEAMIGGGLRVTETTRDVADSLLRPPIPVVSRPLGGLIRLVTVGTLPPRLREDLGLAWSPRHERVLAGSERTVRALLPALPALLHRFPRARNGVLRAA